MRVLQILYSLDMGGIQNFIMNVYRNIDHKKYQFDFVVFQSKKQWFEDEIYSLGGKVYKLPDIKSGIRNHKKYLDQFFKEHQDYSAVHYHTGSLMNIYPLVAAHKAKIPTIILHSHNSNVPGNKSKVMLHKINRLFIKKYATNYFACGNLAKNWMFHNSGCENEVILVNNGINTKKFKYDQCLRVRKRNELNLNDKYIIGQVGRVCEVKNQLFSIEVLKQINDKDYAFVIVGDGPDKSKVLDAISNEKTNKAIYYLGNRNDVNELMQAFDILIMPSLFEGFPVTAIEAQTSGLPCLLSKAITSEAIINNNVVSLSIEDGAAEWAKMIVEKPARVKKISDDLSNRFDISYVVKQLCLVYDKGMVR